MVAEKTSTLEAEAYKTRRLQEELAQLKRRVERLKKIEAAGTADEVLREELREYKDTLTCPSCKVYTQPWSVWLVTHRAKSHQVPGQTNCTALCC